MNSKIYALYADSNGEIFDAPNVYAAGRIGNEIVKLNPDDLIKFVTQSDDLVSQGNQDEVDEEEKQIKKEKTVSKIYLSSLFLTLGSILTYDKIGLIRKFLKFSAIFSLIFSIRFFLYLECLLEVNHFNSL